MHRDLMTLFGTLRGAPAFTWLRIPVRNGPDFRPALLPHVFFSELFDYRRSLWKGASEDHQEQFVSSSNACNTGPLSETVLICQERAVPRLFRWACMAMQALSRSRTVHSSFLGAHCWVLSLQSGSQERWMLCGRCSVGR